jgi:hypothetical protein
MKDLVEIHLYSGLNPRTCRTKRARHLYVRLASSTISRSRNPGLGIDDDLTHDVS